MSLYAKPFVMLNALLLVVGSCLSTAAAVDRAELTSDWEFRRSGTSDWSPASVPGCVHTDLMAAGKIQDPSYRLNEKQQQWVGYSDWEYRTTFDAGERLLAKENVRLVFAGLDTYADVYLNGTRILSANNMFRTWQIDCKELLKPGENQLRVHFHNVFSKTLPPHEQAPFVRQAFRNNDQARVKLNMYSRKAGFHYGWDWGPRLITCGVWRPVAIESWDDVLIEDVFFEQTSVNETQAKITAHVRLNAPPTGHMNVLIRHGEQLLAEESITVTDEDQVAKVDFVIDNPKLWWTHDLGHQPLYEFKTEVRSEKGNVDQDTTTIGIRDLKIVREPDEHGQSMHIELNGTPIFVKGANYIPQDNFQSRVKKQGYRFLIKSARDAHMNLLRVWGGGIYEEDAFYDLCDHNGILVWQDIMFACAMYPADKAFLDNVRAEVIDNARRLRNHPSLALYCGNNEVEISWHDWGWKEKYKEPEQQAYEADLKALFHKTIPKALNESDPTRYYHPSSPITGYSDRPNYNGDVHYWGVWHGNEPFENYAENVGRFMSEYGFQSYPDIESVKRYTVPSDWRMESDVMHAHQRSMADEGRDVDYGNRLINDYLVRYFPPPRDFESHLIATQLLQAYGVRTAIEAHRRRKPYCMGTVYWQLNDCWPVASWSSIDYYGRWKALHYTVKRAYKEVLISTVQRKQNTEIYFVSDRPESEALANLELTLIDFTGKEIWRKSEAVMLTHGESNMIATIVSSDLPKCAAESCFLRVELIEGDETVGTATHYFKYPRELKLTKPGINASIHPNKDGYEISLNAESLAYGAYLTAPDGQGQFSDNYFDMLPGKTYSVQLATDQTYDNPHEAILIRSLYDLSRRLTED